MFVASRLWTTALAFLFCIFLPLSLVPQAAAAESVGSPPPSPAAVTIVAPEAGLVATCGDVLDVLLVVRDGLEVASVAALCDARGIGLAQAPPYAFKWDTKGLEAGEHVLRAFVYLKNGEKLGGTPVTVTLVAGQPASTEPSPAVRTTLKEGTPVLLQTQEKMTSGQVAEGAPVRYKVARDVTDKDGRVLIAYGDFAQGKVTRSRRRGMFGKAGQLEFTVESVTAADGSTVPLRSNQQMAGKDNKGTVIATALLLTVFTVFINGKDVDVPAGTEVMAYVDHDTTVAASTSLQPGAPRGEPQEAATLASPREGREFDIGQRIEVTLSVTPEKKFAKATLYMDGKEAGKVERELKPFLLEAKTLGAGSHRIEVEVQFLSGYVVRTTPVTVVVKAR